MLFSQKIGKTPIDTSLQIDSANESLRSGLWNVLYRMVAEDSLASGGVSYNTELLDDLWELFFKLPVDERPIPKHALVQLKHWVTTADWYRLYDLLEFVVGSIQRSRINAFEASCNKVLERERSGFRLLKGIVVPITDMAEFQSVMDAANGLEKGGLEAARGHLAAALGELGQRVGAGDYDFAILEAARAVRALLQQFAGSDEAEVDEGLHAVAPATSFPAALHSAFENLFTIGETPSDRHLFRSETGEPGLAEARYMVVMASGTINYLLAVAEVPPPPAQNTETKRLAGGSSKALGDGKAVR